MVEGELDEGNGDGTMTMATATTTDTKVGGKAGPLGLWTGGTPILLGLGWALSAEVWCLLCSRRGIVQWLLIILDIYLEFIVLEPWLHQG